MLFRSYFYDFFIQPNTRKFIWRFKKCLFLFIMKPKCIIHLYAEPEIIYARKQELSIDEIREQNRLFEKLFKKNNSYYKIVTTNIAPDEVKNIILELILPDLFRNIED